MQNGSDFHSFISFADAWAEEQENRIVFSYPIHREKLLKNEGIRCHLLRTPKWMESRGCGYSLRIWTNDIDGPVALLRRENVQMQRVYLQIPDGTLEELNL